MSIIKVCVITGSRAEYGLMRWLMEDLKNSSDFDLQVIVTGSHLLEDFGYTYKQIEQDGFFINKKLPELIKFSPTNLYQMSGATDFAKINIILRSLSTSMGLLWEDIATLSKVAISTEKEFDIKIKGVDIIFIKDDKPYYAQIKTLEGTLTGSQVPRSESELSIHENSYFVAAFKTGTSWTFNSKIIERIVGESFWSMIDLEYDFILGEVKSMIKEIEKTYQKSKI